MNLEFPLVTVNVANAIFLFCLVAGGGLLFLSVVLDDILGGLLHAVGIGFDIGGVSLMPMVLGFVAMFGAGGLFGTEVLGFGSGPATIVGVLAGSAGAGVVYVTFGFFRRAESPPPFSLADLVGQTGRVSVTIPAGRYGSVYLVYGGQSHNLTATADRDISAGSDIVVTGVAGANLVVAPGAAASPAMGGSPASGSPS